MFCRICGEKIPDDSLFCPRCGREVVLVDQEMCIRDRGYRGQSPGNG